MLESGEFLKVGSSTVQRTNIRVVAATNVDMLEAVRSGRFREDLFYRLSTVQISVPPLRARGNDITLLTRKFASDFSERYSMPPATFEDSARSEMLHYRWPGNVRQLKNVVEQISLFHAGAKVDAETLRPYLPDAGMNYTPALSHSAHPYEQERELLFNMIFRLQSEIDRLRAKIEDEEPRRPSAAPVQQPVEVIEVPTSLVRYTEPHSRFPSAPVADAQPAASAKTLEETERETIRQALENNGGRRKDTARELNISERTLYRKIKDFGLE